MFEALYLKGCNIDMEGAAEIGTFLSKAQLTQTDISKGVEDSEQNPGYNPETPDPSQL